MIRHATLFAIVVVLLIGAALAPALLIGQEAADPNAATEATATPAQGGNKARGKPWSNSLANAKVITLEVLIVDLLKADVELKAGSTAEVTAQLQALQQAGAADVFRMTLTALENSPAMAQFGETKHVVSGQQRMPFGGRGGQGRGGEAPNDAALRAAGLIQYSTSQENIGTMIGSTAIVEPSGAILTELDVEQSRFADAPADDGSPTANLAGKTVIHSQTTLRIPADRTIEVARKSATIGGKSVQTVLLISGKHE